MKVEKTAARVWCVLLLASVTATALDACGRRPPVAHGAPAAASADARAVRVVRVESRELAGGLTASGVLISREEAAVATELSGYRVAKVYVDQGAWVKAGQPLVQLDDTLLRAQIDQAAAQAAQADTQAKRVSGLDSEGVLSQEQIETRRYAATVQDAALAELKTRDRLMTVRAPVSGLILEKNVRPGDIATASSATPMFRMVRDGLVELNAEIAEDDLWHIKPGDPVKVTLPDEQVIDGSVRLVDPEVDAQTKLGRVRVRLPVRADLRPGGFARGSFVGVSLAERTVPETAVRYDADGASVMVLGDDNKVRQVDVKTGRRASGLVELLQGPPVGARVLLGAASFVLPGDLVHPIDVQESGPAPASTRKGG